MKRDRTKARWKLSKASIKFYSSKSSTWSKWWGVMKSEKRKQPRRKHILLNQGLRDPSF